MGYGSYNIDNLLAFAQIGKDDARLQGQFYNRYEQLRSEALSTFDEEGLMAVRQNAINYYNKNKSKMDDYTIDAWVTLLGEYDVDDNKGTYIGGDINAHMDKVKGHNMGMEVMKGYQETLVDIMEKFNYIGDKTEFEGKIGTDDFGDDITEIREITDLNELEQYRHAEREKLKNVLTNTITSYNEFRGNHQEKYLDILRAKPNDFNTLNQTSELYGLSVDFIDDEDKVFDVNEKQALKADLANPFNKNRSTINYLKGEIEFNKGVLSNYQKEIDKQFELGQLNKSILDTRNDIFTDHEQFNDATSQEDLVAYEQWKSSPALIDGSVIPHPSGKEGEYLTKGDIVSGIDAEVNSFFNEATKDYNNSRKLISNYNNKIYDMTDKNYLRTKIPSSTNASWQSEMEEISGIESGYIPMSYESVVAGKENRAEFTIDGMPIFKEAITGKVGEDEKVDFQSLLQGDLVTEDRSGRKTSIDAKGTKKVETKTGYSVVYPKDAGNNQVIWDNLYRYKQKHGQIPNKVVDELAIELFGDDSYRNTQKVREIFAEEERKYAEEKGVERGEYKKTTTVGGLGIGESVKYEFIHESNRVKPELRPWEEKYIIGSPTMSKEYQKDSKNGIIIGDWNVYTKGDAPADGQYFREETASYINFLLKNHNNDINALIQFTKEVSGLGIDMEKNEGLKKEFKKVGNRIRTLMDKEDYIFQKSTLKALNEFTEAVDLPNYGPGIAPIKKQEKRVDVDIDIENNTIQGESFSKPITLYDVQDAYRTHYKQLKKDDVEFRKRWPNFAEYWKHNKPEEKLREIKFKRTQDK